jgi:hypothetical protein
MRRTTTRLQQALKVDKKAVIVNRMCRLVMKAETKMLGEKKSAYKATNIKHTKSLHPSKRKTAIWNPKRDHLGTTNTDKSFIKTKKATEAIIGR